MNTYDHHDWEDAREPPEPEEQVTYFDYYISTDQPEGPIIDDDQVGSGPVLVHCSTNDNRDQGYPSEDAQWSMRFRYLESALSVTGKSRVGFIGTVVSVWVDGEKV